jgi:hypothetical protein
MSSNPCTSNILGHPSRLDKSDRGDEGFPGESVSLRQLASDQKTWPMCGTNNELWLSARGKLLSAATVSRALGDSETYLDPPEQVSAAAPTNQLVVANVPSRGLIILGHTITNPPGRGTSVAPACRRMLLALCPYCAELQPMASFRAKTSTIAFF